MLTRLHLEEVTFSLLAEGTVQASKAQYSFQSRKPLLCTTQVLSYTSQLLCVSWYTSPTGKTDLARNVPISSNCVYLIIKMVILWSVQRVVESRNKYGFDRKSKSRVFSSSGALVA